MRSLIVPYLSVRRHLGEPLVSGSCLALNVALVLTAVRGQSCIVYSQMMMVTAFASICRHHTHLVVLLHQMYAHQEHPVYPLSCECSIVEG